MKDFRDFKARNLQADTAGVMTVFGRKSVSAADDARYHREIDVAHETAMRLLERYHSWLNS